MIDDVLIDVPLDSLAPEKRLLVAIIQRAVIDYCLPIQGHLYLQREAKRWLFSTSNAPYSLSWICEMLSDSPEWLRKSILDKASSGTVRSNTVITRVDTK